MMNNQKISVFRVVSPQDGGWSLTPMENLLRGLRSGAESVAMEIYGADGVVCYGLRTNNGQRMSGVLHAYFPQAKVDERVVDANEDSNTEDWLHLDEDERALVLPLSLEKPSYLPLMTYEDRTLLQSTMDPLAGVIGVLAASTRPGGETNGDRLGLRLIIKPAEEHWGRKWQSRMQQRRDGEDRSSVGQAGSDSGPSLTMLATLGGVAFLGLANYWLWNQDRIGIMALLDVLSAASVVGGYKLLKGFSSGHKRQYMDEILVEEKLKSLAFWTELQIVRIYRNMADEMVAQNSVELMVDQLRQFDHPAGNSLKPGRILKYNGVDILQGQVRRHPFVGGNQALDWVRPAVAKRTALSAREVASLWHPPLGTDEMASMERTASGVLIPYLEDLGKGGDDEGPLVGQSALMGQDIRLPESAIRKHTLFVGRSGVGKSTMIKHILAYKLERKAKGLDDGAVVVIDPHADLVRDILKIVPPSIAHKVRLLDMGRLDRVPALNLMDPELFPDRDRCVDTIIQTLKHLWETWGNRLEDLLANSLKIIHEFNAHEATARSEMLTMLDILKLMDGGKEVSHGRSTKLEYDAFQRFVLSRVADPSLKAWFNNYLNWPNDLRAEAMGPVRSRMGAYSQNKRSKVILGQRESTIILKDVLREGQVLLVSTAQGSIGREPAALMGGTMVSLVESALRDQESLPERERAKCLLVCDEFQTVTGANWEGLLAEIRKYGCSLMLATQSLARLDTPERRLKAGILGNVGCIVGYQMSAEDARIVSAEMDSNRVLESYLVNLDPHCAYVRINSDTKCYPAFSLKTLPPPDVTRGSDECVEAVLLAMKDYTCDREEALARMEAEAALSLDDDKIGPDGVPMFDQRQAEVNPETDMYSRMRNESRARVTTGPLRGLPQAAVEDSNYTNEALTRIVRADPKDPGFKQAMDKHLGDRLAAERRKVRRDEIERIKEEVLKEAAGDLEAQRERIAVEEREKARGEIARKMLGSRAGENSTDGETPTDGGTPTRDISRLRSLRWQEKSAEQED